MIPITGLWINEKKDGEKYFTGYMGSAKVLIFKNKNKKTDKHPDYNMVLAENAKKDEVKNEAPSVSKNDDFGW